MSPVNQAYLLKGWLLDKHPPQEVTEAMEAVIGALGREVTTVGACLAQIPSIPASVLAVGQAVPDEPSEPVEVATDVAEGEQQEIVSVSTDPAQDAPPKKKRNFSPEARAAAAERMRALQARKRAEKEGVATPEPNLVPVTSSTAPAKPFTPVSHEKLISDHSSYAGKRDPGQPLTDEDWPDIKARLAKSPDRRAIASDYDVDLDDLNFFIASCQRREGKSPGESLASPSSRASGAARPTW